MQPANQQDMQARVAVRYRTMLTLWFALSVSIVMYYVLARVAAPRPIGASQNATLSLVLAVVGGASALVSHLVRLQFVNRAASEHRMELVQIGLIIGAALTEVAPLLGLIDAFVNVNPYYHILFLLGGASMLLHFPRRDHLLAAL